MTTYNLELSEEEADELQSVFQDAGYYNDPLRSAIWGSLDGVDGT